MRSQSDNRRAERGSYPEVVGHFSGKASEQWEEGTMAGKNTAAFGIYHSRSAADEGVTALRQNGFRLEDISLLMPENVGSKDLATEKASKAPEGAATGGGAGAAIGGT